MSIKIFQEINETKLPDELGILNSKEVVTEYIKYGEIGLAFEHLIYTIDSMGFKTTTEEKEKIEKIGKSLKINIPKTLVKKMLTQTETKRLDEIQNKRSTTISISNNG